MNKNTKSTAKTTTTDNSAPRPLGKETSSILFSDALDSSHFLRAVAQTESHVVCRVYYGTKKNHVFFGTTTYPKSLFDFDGRSTYGFNAL